HQEEGRQDRRQVRSVDGLEIGGQTMERRIDSERRRRAIKERIRRRLSGSPERPRLVVFKSEKHIYAQVVDDAAGRTLVAASTLDEPLRAAGTRGGSVAAAKTVGSTIAQRAKDKGIEQVVFDRGGYIYHGRVKALADA